jgi:hypothetical protein
VVSSRGIPSVRRDLVIGPSGRPSAVRVECQGLAAGFTVAIVFPNGFPTIAIWAGETAQAYHRYTAVSGRT